MSLHPKPKPLTMLASLFAVQLLKTGQVQCRPIKKSVSRCCDIRLRPVTKSDILVSNLFGRREGPWGVGVRRSLICSPVVSWRMLSQLCNL
jgi:hypothetical protein